MKKEPLSGRYELIEIIGTGGMSVVYRAWDLKLDREVSVKVLRPEYASDELFVRQFNHEAQAASQMTHPNIVAMHDVGQDGETRYLVMEYVKGMTLKELIRQDGPFEPQKAVSVMLKILAALGHAHKSRIVHRDIKPQNILVDCEGRIKVTDFGIARQVNSNATGIGGDNILGSVHYFSPEQAKGDAVDEKSDLYSAGVVLYEMLTGRVPFDGDTGVAVALKHINEPPVPPSRYNPKVSKGMDEVVLKALEKTVDRRYQSAAEMGVDLKRALKIPQGGFISRNPKKSRRTPPKQKKNRKRRLVKGLIAAAAVLVFAALGVQAWRFYEKLQTRIRVPSVELYEVEDAQAYLEDLGLSVGIAEVYDDETVSGVVIGQSPENGGLLYPGAEVRLTVSLGREWVEVPNVCGQPRSEAAQTLTENGLSVGSVELEISDDVPVGSVIRQEPGAAERAVPFSEVNLFVSGECSVVPDLDNMTVEEAQSALATAGLALGTVTGEGELVSEQSIAAGERVLWGVVVDVTVSGTQESEETAEETAQQPE